MNRKELEDFERLSPAALKRRVDDAILTSSKEEVRKAGIQGVRKSGKKKVVITAHSEEDAEILLRSADDWMARAFTGAAPAKQVCQVMVHFVPTSFTPGEKESTLELCSANRNLNLDPNQISGSRWVRKIDGLNKSKSSMILTVTDANLADRMIDKELKSSGQTPYNVSNAKDMDTRHEPVKNKNPPVQDAQGSTPQDPNYAPVSAEALLAQT
ncbi:hypothetical protein FRC18_001938 [Serendipita sp. 400]|nr:hypothetical protein FRC18_001938 [Serendipita sp. 400]